MPKFIVVHGSVSGKKVGQSIELDQAEADHINSSGKMLRGVDEPEEERVRAENGVRVGLDGKKRGVKLQGTVLESSADAEPLEEQVEESEPAAPAKKAKAPAKKKGV